MIWKSFYQLAKGLAALNEQLEVITTEMDNELGWTY